MAKFIATGFGSGYAPLAPGTAGTIVAIPVYLLFSTYPRPVYVLTVLALTFLACYVSGLAEKIFDRKDAPAIVIDEIVGYLWTMLFIAPSLPHLIGGFVLFRFFDITKIFPARLCEQRFPGGYGVVMDDIVAGIYANIFLQVVIGIWRI